jgi:hypothetical protein
MACGGRRNVCAPHHEKVRKIDRVRIRLCQCRAGRYPHHRHHIGVIGPVPPGRFTGGVRARPDASKSRPDVVGKSFECRLGAGPATFAASIDRKRHILRYAHMFYAYFGSAGRGNRVGLSPKPDRLAGGRVFPCHGVENSRFMEVFSYLNEPGPCGAHDVF